MAEWAIASPTSLADALAELARTGEDALPVAGGVWVTLMLRNGLARPRLLLDLRRVSDLALLNQEADGSLWIGALVTHRTVERAPVVRARWPVLADTLAEVANVRVREQATLVGNLCEADPASDPPAVLAALGATVELVSQRGRRAMPVADFVLGAYQTQREPDELVTAVRLPPLPPGAGAAYCKFRTRSHEDRPAVGVAAVVALDSDGTVRHLEVTVGAAGDRPQRMPEVLAAARGTVFDAALVDAIAEAYARAIDCVSDLRASAWYRREMVRVFVARTLWRAAQRAMHSERTGEGVDR